MFEYLDPSWLALFGKGVEPLASVDLLEEVSPWVWTLRHHSQAQFSVPSLLPKCGYNTTSKHSDTANRPFLPATMSSLPG